MIEINPNQIVTAVIIFFLTIGITMVFTNSQKKFNELENEIKNIKGNYLNRFQKIYEQATMNNEKIMNGLNEIKLLIEREFVRKKDLEEIKRKEE